MIFKNILFQLFQFIFFIFQFISISIDIGVIYYIVYIYMNELVNINHVGKYPGTFNNN